jgi:multiple sugar transport system substrate-binding protein
MKTKLRTYSVFLICLFITVYVLSVGPVDDKPAEGEVLVRFWYPWGAKAGETVVNAIEAFNEIGAKDPETNKRIRVIPLFAPARGGANQKLFMSIVGGCPPDVTFVDGPQVSEWAHQGGLTDLGPFIESAGIREEDYFPPCWRQNIYEGKVYALTFCADPNFGFFWSKEAFKRAGLDPNRPPLTIEELDKFSEKLTVKKGDYFESIGIIPWAVYGEANSLYTWGWAFGGRFYDYENQRITCDDERIVRALEWMVSYDEKFDKEKITALRSDFGNGEQNPLILGKQAMMAMQIKGVDDLRRYAPGLEIGISSIPSPQGAKWGKGEENSSWIGGHCLTIPKGSLHPEAAFEVIRWLCHTDEGTDFVVKATGSFPGKRNCRYIQWLSSPQGAEKDSQRHRLLQILEECKHQRPVIPVQKYYMDQLKTAVNDSLYKGIPPRKTLAKARENTQSVLDNALDRLKRNKQP